MDKDPAVDAYIDEAPEKRRDALVALRNACLEELDGFAESTAYRMPSYERDGEIEITFASQKQYISLYILRTHVAEAHRSQLGRLDVGKACVRYRRPEDIDLGIVRSMLQATLASKGKVC